MSSSSLSLGAADAHDAAGSTGVASEQVLGPNWIEQLFQQTNDLALLVADADGIITEWQGSAPRMFGHERDEAIGQPYSLIFTEQDRATGLHALELAVAASAGRSEDDRWHLRRDGSTFWGSGVVQSIRDADGQLVGYCKVLRDRTDVRTQIVALENRLKLGDSQKSEQRSTFATIAHELRNPMGAITNAGFLLTKSADEHTRARAADVLTRQLGVLKRLVDDLSELSKAQVGEKILNITTFELQAALRTALEGFFVAAERDSQVLRLVMPDGSVMLQADAERVQQMILNLVDNALKYAPGGSVTVSLSVEGASAVIRVDDDGVGIAPESLHSIFELFTRETRGGKAPEGLGVGLSVVKELAHAHGGLIEARSPGKGLGSVFTLRLPLKAQPWRIKDES